MSRGAARGSRVARRAVVTSPAKTAVAEFCAKPEPEAGECRENPGKSGYPPSSRGWQWCVEARCRRWPGAPYGHRRSRSGLSPRNGCIAVRIALKKLAKYGVELWLEAGGPAENADLRRLKRSQELLGDLHDRAARPDHARASRTGGSSLLPEIAPPDNAAVRRAARRAGITSLENTCAAPCTPATAWDRAVLIALCEDRFATRPDRVRLRGGLDNAETLKSEIRSRKSERFGFQHSGFSRDQRMPDLYASVARSRHGAAE